MASPNLIWNVGIKIFIFLVINYKPICRLFYFLFFLFLFVQQKIAWLTTINNTELKLTFFCSIKTFTCLNRVWCGSWFCFIWNDLLNGIKYLLRINPVFLFCYFDPVQENHSIVYESLNLLISPQHQNSNSSRFCPVSIVNYSSCN